MIFNKDLLSSDLNEKSLKRILQIINLLLTVIVAFANIETIYAYDPLDLYSLFQFSIIKHIGYIWASLILIFMFLLLMFGNTFVASVVFIILSFVYGVANRYFKINRGAYLTLADIKNFREAIKLDHSQTNILCGYILILALINVLVIIACYYLKYPSLNRRRYKKYLYFRIIGMIIIVVGYCFIYRVMLKNIYVDALINNENMGAFVTLNESLFESYYRRVEVDKVNEIISGYNSDEEFKEDVHKPNIIVIMSEAFWDPNNFTDHIKCDKNPMERYYEISSESISGECGVDIYGGGTVTSEWEFNTGVSNGNPYGIPLTWYDFREDKYSSLVSYLGELGYHTMAFHGYDGTYYERNTVYPNMGFDVFYDGDLFVHNDVYNGYISDKSMVEEIEYRYEEYRKQNKENPIYVFSVSVQNHIFNMRGRVNDYKDPQNSIHVTIDYPNINEEARKKIEKYVNGIAISNDAFIELTNYFAKCEEDTMIVLFGDHAPGFADLGIDICKEEHKYRTPYIIWTNYENDYYNPGNINLSYLSTVMLDYLNVPDTLLTKKNKYLMKKYKINTLYEKASLYLNEEQKNIYLKDMFDEKIIYTYCNKKQKSNAYMWDM